MTSGPEFKIRSPSEIWDSLAEQGLSEDEELFHDIFVGGTGFTRTDADGTVTRIDPKDFYSVGDSEGHDRGDHDEMTHHGPPWFIEQEPQCTAQAFTILDAKATYEGETEYLAQQEITALVKIFGREIAQEKVATMLLIAFKETGR